MELVDYLESKGKLFVRQLNDGIEIKFSSYIGVVKFRDFQVVIEPKIGYFNLASMISYAYNLKGIDLLKNNAKLTVEKALMTELMAILFLQEFEQILSRGLVKQYCEQQREISFCRGKIIFGELSKTVNTGFTLPCRFQELTVDIEENRLILAGLKFLSNRVYAPDLKKRMKMYVNLLSERISYEPLSQRLLDRVRLKINRLNQHYIPMIELAEIIINCVDFKLNQGTTPFPSFLLDMNLLFEKFLYRLFEDLAGRDIKVKYQQPLKNYYYNTDNEKHYLIPDFQIFYKGKLVGIADAKYKDYDNKRITSGDLYQLTVYAFANKEQINKVHLFYPTNENSFTFRQIKLAGINKVEIKIKGIPLARILEDVTKGNDIDYCAENLMNDIVCNY